jgi:hypothetical protein
MQGNNGAFVQNQDAHVVLPLIVVPRPNCNSGR